MCKIYMDNAATSRVSKAAMEVMIPCLEDIYGNPSSIHTFGQKANTVLENSRRGIAEIISAESSEIYFTSGGTESDNWAIRAGAYIGKQKGKCHIISSSFEHHAVLHTLNTLQEEGFEITLLDVHEDGIVKTEELLDAIREDTALVTIMYANNEIGTVQPIDEIGKICRENGVLFHTDAVQAVGHIPVNVKEDYIDMLSLSSHKFHGPKGVGVLYCKKGIALKTFIEGGAQERGKRGGTENVPAIAGMAAALKNAVANMQKNNEQITDMREKLIKSLLAIPRSRLNGNGKKRLPSIVNFCFEGIEGEALLLMLDINGICASSGSACTSGTLDPSHVLLALGLPHEIAHGSLRLSLSEYNTHEEVEYIIEILPKIVEKLRDMSPVWEKIVKGN